MNWIRQFHLFLLDFDGLLVNTEALHYQAYANLLARRGYPLPLTFHNFLQLAHLNATAWREALYANIVGLDPDWEVLYREKKEEYARLLEVGKIELMPGVEPLLRALEKEGVRRCVVTNSFLAQVKQIREKIPVLQSLPHWITREDYGSAKPSPECYLKAIELYGKEGDQIIGFEDSMRGLEALQKTAALPVLICAKDHPLLQKGLPGKALHFETFESSSMPARLLQGLTAVLKK